MIEGEATLAVKSVARPALVHTARHPVTEARAVEVAAAYASSPAVAELHRLPAIFESTVAPMIGSGAKRRPNPPPRYMVLTFTLPGTTPATWARMPCAGPWDCFLPRSRLPLRALQAVASLSGSMHECERYGASYSGSIFFAGVAGLGVGSLRP